MMKRKPYIELYWTMRTVEADPPKVVKEINWRLVSGNGETMCQCTQGFRDKTDAYRSVAACGAAIGGSHDGAMFTIPIKGPGKKPK